MHFRAIKILSSFDFVGFLKPPRAISVDVNSSRTLLDRTKNETKLSSENIYKWASLFATKAEKRQIENQQAKYNQ